VWFILKRYRKNEGFLFIPAKASTWTLPEPRANQKRKEWKAHTANFTVSGCHRGLLLSGRNRGDFRVGRALSLTSLIVFSTHNLQKQRVEKLAKKTDRWGTGGRRNHHHCRGSPFQFSEKYIEGITGQEEKHPVIERFLGRKHSTGIGFTSYLVGCSLLQERANLLEIEKWPADPFHLQQHVKPLVVGMSSTRNEPSEGLLTKTPSERGRRALHA